LRSIDVEGMRKDIPKFYKLMPPSAVDQWKERLLHLDSWLLSVLERPYWPLVDLLRATRPSIPESEEEALASLQLLRDKELAPIKEVILKNRNIARLIEVTIRRLFMIIRIIRGKIIISLLY